jgi:hypothetical protein
VTFKASTDPNWRVCRFSFSHALVGLVKQLHPARRQWVPGSRYWLVRLTAIPDLLNLIGEDDDVTSCPPSAGFGSLLELAAVATIAEAALAEAELQRVVAARAKELAATEKARVAAREEEDATAARDGASRNQSAKRHRAGPWPPVHVSGPYPIGWPPPSTVPPRHNHAHHAREYPSKSLPNCICLRPTPNVINGEHQCRLFGRFKCRCQNVWTSAYVHHFLIF